MSLIFCAQMVGKPVTRHPIRRPRRPQRRPLAAGGGELACVGLLSVGLLAGGEWLDCCASRHAVPLNAPVLFAIPPLQAACAGLRCGAA